MIILSFLIRICGKYEIIWGVIWNLQAVMILKDQICCLIHCLSAVRESRKWRATVSRVAKSGTQLSTHARMHACTHNLILPISDLLTVLMLFFSQKRFHMSKYFLFLSSQLLLSKYLFLFSSFSSVLQMCTIWEDLVMQYIRALSFQVGSKGYVYSGYVLFSTYNKPHIYCILFCLHRSIFFVTLFSENAVN